MSEQHAGTQGAPGAPGTQDGQAGQPGPNGQGQPGAQGQQAGQDGNTGQSAQGSQNPFHNTNPWATMKAAGSDDRGAASSQATPSSGGKDPAQAFAEHIKGLDLTRGIDFGALGESLRSGDNDALKAAFETIGGNAYREAVVQTSSVADKRAEQATEAAKSAATKEMHSDLALKYLRDNMGFIDQEAVLPLAKATLTGFMRQGQSPEIAAKNTEMYLAKLGGVIAEHYQARGSAPEEVPGLQALTKSAEIGNNDNLQGVEVDFGEVFNL